MAMTVMELLAEPHLGLELVAGNAGLTSSITWSHTSDLPKLWEWVSSGVLLMTNGLSIPNGPEEQVRLAKELVSAGAVGFAVGEGMHSPAFSPEFIEACDELPLPLISVPYPLPFMAISRAIAEASLLEESRRIKQTARIYDLLRKATTLGETWTFLLEWVEAELTSKVYVVDGRCLHAWQLGDRSMSGEQLDRVHRVHKEAASGTRHFLWNEENGSSLLIMEVPAHSNVLLVVAPDIASRPDGVVLLHVATILGLGLSRTDLALENSYRSGGELLRQAIDGRFSDEEITRRLGEYGIPDGDIRIVSLMNEPETMPFELQRSLWSHRINSVCVLDDARIHLMVSGKCPDEVLLHSTGSGTSLGMSTPVGVGALQRGLRESNWALGQALSTGVRSVCYEAESSWYGIGGYQDAETFIRRVLMPVADHDKSNGTDFLFTLRTYLDSQRSAQKTADKLFVHRQTVNYRIQRIGELTGLDLAETSSVAQLWMAFQMYEAIGPSGMTPRD